MKVILPLVVLSIFFMSYAGQKGYYCELLINNPGGGRNYTAEIDYGDKELEKILIYDRRSKKNHVQRFFSPVGALNIMHRNGWEIVATFDNEHYLLKRRLLTETQKDSIEYISKLKTASIWVSEISTNSKRKLNYIIIEASDLFDVKPEDLKNQINKQK